jgi:hypothetical protein
LLRMGSTRPRRRRPAEKGDELAPFQLAGLHLATMEFVTA